MANLKNTSINDTGSLKIPSGDSSNRPTNPESGDIYFNNDLLSFEYYDGSKWNRSNYQMQASGGDLVSTVIDNGIKYKSHSFYSSGTFTVSTPGEVEYLIVAGGGGGGNDHGGGGGGGGVLHGTTVLSPGTYTITVGSGGAGAPAVRNNTTARGLSGSDSSAFGFTAIGGGGGGGSSGSTSSNGRNGGSGGGSSGYGQPRNPGSGTAGQGFDGGQGGNNSPDYQGAGGGGASQEGFDGQNPATNARGGIGKGSLISGVGLYYSGGGGGCSGYSDNNTFGTGGSGGGGRGATVSKTAKDAVQNSGGGGGGANRHSEGGDHQSSSIGTAGSGGSGVVIVRYKIPSENFIVPEVPIGGQRIRLEGNELVNDASDDPSTWRNLTLENEPSPRTSFGGYLSFSDGDDYAIDSEFENEADPIFSIAMWCRRQGTINNDGFWGLGGSSTARGINNYSTSAAENRIGWDLWSSQRFYTDLTYPLGDWIHVVWIKYATGFNLNTLKTIVNGVEEPMTQISSGTATPNLVDGLVLGRIGVSDDTHYCAVDLADVIVYDRALTNEQAAQIYESTRRRFGK